MSHTKTRLQPLLNSTTIASFQEKVYEHYRQHGRSFPWRDQADSYRVLISEVMLQQTQAERVVPKYEAFLRRWPDLPALAAAPVRDVLQAWQGLGYNRRAVMLHRLAQQVMMDYRGRLPDDETELAKLPGVGPYTAAAIATFAGNHPTVVVETNIRSVYIHHFGGDQEVISDAEIIPLVKATVDQDNPREWYQALMDYGAHLKKTGLNPSRRSAHYVRQSAFEGSDRQVRGRVIRILLTRRALSVSELSRDTTCPSARLHRILAGMQQDGLVAQVAGRFTLSPA